MLRVAVLHVSFFFLWYLITLLHLKSFQFRMWLENILGFIFRLVPYRRNSSDEYGHKGSVRKSLALHRHEYKLKSPLCPSKRGTVTLMFAMRNHVDRPGSSSMVPYGRPQSSWAVLVQRLWRETQESLRAFRGSWGCEIRQSLHSKLQIWCGILSISRMTLISMRKISNVKTRTLSILL